MSNLDMFNEVTAKVLAACYENFPVPITISADSFSPSGGEDVFESTVTWLRDYGYITYAEPDLPICEFMYVQLTEKDIAILNKIPDAIKEKKTIGSKIAEAVKSGSKEILSECIRQTVQAAIN